ncbi:MAG: hypothetical protein AAF652_15490 [Cyanobacteria bacterium P01_C01_bin.72]
MKITKLFTLTIFVTIFVSVIGLSRAMAHEYCESYLDCHQKPENLEKVNYWTNYFFKLLRPEMRNKKVRIHHTLYRRERAEIRRVVNQVIHQSCQKPHINHYYLLLERDRNRERPELRQRLTSKNRLRTKISSNRNSYRYRDYYYYDDELLWDEELWGEGYYWERTNDYFFTGLYRDLTDAVFYARHPELVRRISPRDTLDWSGEWSFIRQHFADFEQEKFLKQQLVPLCDRYINY